MSASDIARFVSDLKSSPELANELKAAATGLATVVDFAKSKGYDISVDEAKAYIREQSKQELSDDQLDAIAGGKHTVTATHTNVDVNAEALANAVAVANAVELANVATTTNAAAEAEVAVVVAIAVVVT